MWLDILPSRSVFSTLAFRFRWSIMKHRGCRKLLASKLVEKWVFRLMNSIRISDLAYCSYEQHHSAHWWSMCTNRNEDSCDDELFVISIFHQTHFSIWSWWFISSLSTLKLSVPISWKLVAFKVPESYQFPADSFSTQKLLDPISWEWITSIIFQL